MSKVKPYNFQAAKALAEQAVKNSQRRHAFWRGLEHLYRRGELLDGLLTAKDVPEIIWQEMPGLTLDTINLILPNAQVIITQSMQHDPAFLVEPYTGGDEAEEEAKLGEQLLRYFWKRADGTDVHRSMVQDAVVLGSGFCKTGWAFMEEEVERSEEDLIQELLSMEQAEARDADLTRREPRSIQTLAEMIELQEPRVITDEPFIEYVSPYDIFVPEHARRLEECRWVAQRVILPADEVHSNPQFNREAIKELQYYTAGQEDRPDARAGEEDEYQQGGESTDLPPEEDPFKEVVLYEFYDLRARKLMVFQLDGKRPLFHDDLPYSHRYTPFVHMRNLEDGGRRFWSFGDMENVAAIQEEYNTTIFDQMSSARRAGNKTFVDKTIWNEDIKGFLESEQSDVAIPVDVPNARTLTELVFNIERKPASAETFQAKEDLSGAIERVLGINDFQAGGVGADRMSATAAAVVDGNATLRGSDKRWQVELAAATTGLKMLLLCQEFLDEEIALRIVGPDGKVQWLDVSKQELLGEFGVSVTSGSTMAVNPATKMARALDVLAQMVPLLDGLGYDTQPMIREALRDYGMDPDRMLRKLDPAELAARMGQPMPGAGGSDPTVPQEEMGGPPVPAAVEGDTAL